MAGVNAVFLTASEHPGSPGGVGAGRVLDACSQMSRRRPSRSPPTPGAGNSQVFSFVTADANGATDITATYLDFGSPSGTACIVTVLAPASLYLLNENEHGLPRPGNLRNGGHAGEQPLPGQRHGLRGADWWAITQILTLQIAFTPALAGSVAILVGRCGQHRSADDVPENGDLAGAGRKLSAGAGIGNAERRASVTQIFSFVTSDPNGAADIAQTHVVFANVGGPWCYAELIVPNSLYLMNDTNSGWLGPVVLGTPATLENSRCRVNGTASGLRNLGSNIGNDQTFTLEVTFKALMAGTNGVFLAAGDAAGAFAGVATDRHLDRALAATPAAGAPRLPRWCRGRVGR